MNSVIPDSLLSSYNAEVAPVLVTFRLQGFPFQGYPTGTPQNTALRVGVAKDVAAALVVDPSQITVRDVLQEGEGLKVEIQITVAAAGSANSMTPTALSEALHKMVDDKHSLLHKGEYAIHVEPLSFTSTKTFKTDLEVKEERIKAILARRNSRKTA